MGLPLSPKLGNVFLVYIGKNRLQSCFSDFKLHYYWQYVDDIFVFFTSPEHLEAFLNCLNGLHANVLFTLDSKKRNKILFLDDFWIIREGKTITASVYLKLYF